MDVPVPRVMEESEFTVDGDRRLTWYADRSADLSGMKNPRLNVLVVDPSGQSREKSTALNES